MSRVMTFGECVDCGSLNKIENQYLMLCAGCAHARRKAERNSKKVKIVAPVQKVSEHRAAELREYYKLEVVFLKENPSCGVRECHNRSNQVHHMKGRENELLLEVKWWLAVCPDCHRKITTDSAWAIDEGYSIKRTV